ncbi:hypothetical protein TTHERM_00494090 (macronuclear) [Tetrahymena thermophila SB210]|uniref:PDIA6-like C-terminal thioredoxin-like domain-containing protein n=1 Tax=Tetrahymena thermophila (strain SB210) TaxID=312017 RepID=I7M9W7_TETTS|nr:hypothetical protein TTHERM_00494090 [Tetrahymena thermophila SB210]EAS02957.1 hypothetical protein TTHERM_00494090 [Tetrahymena thermophila SB210]|eukprot:XP_001023202.1 hypothetical protein TTHERM_00494090 [Tetrahymena thermophila SB210]
MNKQTLIILGLLISTAFCLFENDNLVKPITTLEQIEQVRNGGVDRLSVVIYWHEDSTQTPTIEKPIYDLAQQYEGFFSIYQVDCEFFSEEEIKYCGHENTVRDLPVVEIFAPPSSKTNPITKKPNEVKVLKYGGSIDAKSISTFAIPHMPSYVIRRPSLSQLSKNILSQVEHKKVFLFTNKEETPALFKALSAIYRYRLKFVEINQSQTDIIKQFNISNFPTLLVAFINDDGQVQGVAYQDQFKISKIQSFLDKYALKEKVVVDFDIEGRHEAGDSSKQQFQSAFNDEDEETKEIKDNSVEELKQNKYDKTLLQIEGIVVLHVYTEKEKQHAEFLPLKEKLAEASKYFEFLADTPEKVAFAESTLGIKSFPSIKVYPFQVEKKANSKYVYGHNISSKTIIEEIDEITDDESTGVSDDKTFQMLMSSALQEGKIVQILFHAKPRIPLGFRLASKGTEYKKKFRFLNYRNAPQQLLQQTGIHKVPAVSVVFRNVPEEEKDTPIKPEQVQGTQYTGKLTYKDYSQFLNIFITKPGETKTKKKITEIVTQQDLENVCMKKSRICFIALLNGEPELRKFSNEDDDDQKSKTKLQQQLQIYDQVKDKIGDRPVTFGWIDAVCHSEILAALEIYEDNLPNYILYNGSQKHFSALIGRFDVENLENFTLRGIQGKTRIQTLPQELKLTDHDCQVQHDKIKKQREEYERQQQSNNDLEDEIAREILEEERLKKEKIEAELKSERSSSKKRKSKGKKKQDL